MAITFEQLTAFLKDAGVRYLLVPDQPVLAVGSITDSGRHFLLHVSLEADGSLLQMRTTGYMLCPLSSPHLPAVMTLLNGLNWRLRLVKFTLDPNDGEITIFSDLPLIDAHATKSQIMGMLSFIMERLREVADRIEATVRTGQDPGEEELIGEEAEPEEPDEPEPDDIIT